MNFRRLPGAIRRAQPTTLALLVVLLAAFALRVYHLNWDEGHHLHPDERHISNVLASRYSIDWPPDLDNLLNPSVSHLNPRSDDPQTGTPRDFAYGALPLFVTDLTASVMDTFSTTDWTTYDRIYLVGRAWSALFDTLTVLVVFLMGRHIFNRRVGLLAAMVAAAAPMSIQLAHFFTTDSWLTFFVAVTLLLAVRAAEGGGIWWFTAAGAAFGLAMATKGSVFTLAGVLGVALAFDAYRRWRDGADPLAAVLREPVRLLCAGAAALVAFALFEPYAIARPKVYLDQIQYQSNIVRGIFDVPYTRQYIGTTPVIYQIEQLLKWGFGPVAGILALAGVVVLARRFFSRQLAGPTILLAWFFGYGFVISIPETKFLRYLAPLIPVLAVTAGVAFDSLWTWLSARVNRRVALIAPVALLIGIGLWTSAFTSIYAGENPRIAASKWIYANVPPGSSVSAEYWDDSLPLGLAPGLTPDDYELTTVNFDLYADRPTKEEADYLYQNLQQTDYVILSSNRVSSAMPHSPWRYPVQDRYYQLLESGQLGFEQVADFHLYPGIGSWRIPDQSADESFINYDHPRVLIFKKQSLVPRAAYDELMAWAVAQQTTPARHPHQKSLLLGKPVGELPVVDDARWSAAVTDNSVVALLVWLVLLVVLHAAAFPIVSVIFGRFADAGWGFSRLVSLLLVGYLVWIGASSHAISFRAVWAAVAVSIVASSWLARWRWPQRAGAGRTAQQRRTAYWCELIFWLAFGLFLLFRYLNPDSWHPYWGGEKPMEFAHINAMLRSAHFPPYDPWFADGYINYYYYGLYLVAFTFKLTGIPSEIAFNLAEPTIIAILAAGAFSVASTLGADGSARRRLAVPGGILGALLVVGIGNLTAFVNFLDALPGPIQPSFGWTWGATRVIDPGNTITEFPYFSGLWADLHAHVVALPITVLAIGLAYSVARQPWLLRIALTSRRASSNARLLIGGRLLLLALALGTLSATNAWDVPVYLALAGVAAFMAGSFLRSWIARLALAVATALAVGAVGYLLFLPFFRHYVALFGSLGKVRTTTDYWQFSDHLGGLLTIAGLGLIVVAVGARRRGSVTFPHPVVPLVVLVGIGLVRWLVLDPGDPLRGLLTKLFSAAVLLLMAGTAWAAASMSLRSLFGHLARLAAIAALGGGIVALVADKTVLATALGFAGAGAAVWLSSERRALAFAGAMVAAASLIVAGVELVYLVDDLSGGPAYRMNTVFKFYNQVWVLLALAGASLTTYVLGQLFHRVRPVGSWITRPSAPVGLLAGSMAPERSTESATRQPVHSLVERWSFVSVVVIALMIGASLFYPLLATKPRLEQRFADHLGSGTLNALDWMNYGTITNSAGQTISFKDDLAAIDWFNEHVAGSPVIAEAAIGPYRCDGSRFSIATGLPAIIGWDRHEYQQRYPDEIPQRMADMRLLYTTPDPAVKLQILRRYNVEYVVVGDLERMYPTVQGNDCVDSGSAEGIAAFDQMVGKNLEIAFQKGSTTVYRVLPPTAGA
jgi:YYY domain-containing protein